MCIRDSWSVGHVCYLLSCHVVVCFVEIGHWFLSPGCQNVVGGSVLVLGLCGLIRCVRCIDCYLILVFLSR